MREKVIKLGRIRTIAIVTIFCISISVAVTSIALYVFGLIAFSLNTLAGLTIAICAPLIVAPSITWIMTGMIFEIHGLEEKMRWLATYDSLTGLLSRRAFIEQTNYICRFAERQGLDFTIMVIDMDHFKKVNDNYGHGAGDKVLESFGKIIRQVSRESDLAGRIGGEEFSLFLPVTNMGNACNLAERLHETIRNSVIIWDGRAIRYTVSIGLAFFPHTVNNIKVALNCADKALYEAKRNGRNQTVIYNPDAVNSLESKLS